MPKDRSPTYRKEYNRKYKEVKRKVGNPHFKIKKTIEDKYLIEKHRDRVLSIEPTDMNFKGSDRDEPECCNEFGCGRVLNSQEKLFGNKCINHQTKKKIDINTVLSYPLKNAI